ncbi:MAG: hypothetical protein H6711_28580 [Myxococcales bacterium]|nr:hypothetical protein [Myxococcales bacterium]
MRAALLAEQGHLCAYCMSRVHNDPHRCGVEHWRPRSDPGTDPFHWNDLLAVCDGNAGAPHVLQHCDKHRGDAPLTLHPASPAQNVEDRVAYRLDGRIECADADALNLNCRRLLENRRMVQDAVRQRCLNFDATALRQDLAEWSGVDAEGRRRPFAGVALALLRRRLEAVEKRSKRTRGNRER